MSEYDDLGYRPTNGLTYVGAERSSCWALIGGTHGVRRRTREAMLRSPADRAPGVALDSDNLRWGCLSLGLSLLRAARSHLCRVCAATLRCRGWRVNHLTRCSARHHGACAAASRR